MKHMQHLFEVQKMSYGVSHVALQGQGVSFYGKKAYMGFFYTV